MDKKPGTNRRMVTAKECLEFSLVCLVMALLTPLSGLLLLYVAGRHSWLGFIGLFLAAETIVVICIGVREWRKYGAIKNGTVIYAKASRTLTEQLMQPTISDTVLLTGISILTSVGCLWLWHLLGQEAAVCIFLAGLLWTYTLFYWYRLLFCRPKAALSAEVEEGIWPPPPIRPDGPPT